MSGSRHRVELRAESSVKRKLLAAGIRVSKPSLSVFQNLLLSGCGDTLSLCPGLTGESVFIRCECACVRDCVYLSVWFLVCVCGMFEKEGLTLNVCFFLPAVSPGMSWPWMVATGNELTFLTFRGTLRWVSLIWPSSYIRLVRDFALWCVLLPSHFLLKLLLLLRCKSKSRLSELSFEIYVLQGRVVENISKRCGGFLRKLSLRGCLGVGDSALRWHTVAWQKI